MRKLPRSPPCERPARRDRGQGLDDKGTGASRRVRHDELARAPLASAPADNVEIEHPASPATAWAPAEIALDLLEPAQNGGRSEPAFDQGHAIGELPPGSAMRLVENDGRSVEQAESATQARDRSLDDARGAAEGAVRPVRSDRDCIEVGRLVQRNRSP